MESKTVELGGTFLAYKEAGAGPTTLFLPALDEGSFVYALQLEDPGRIGRVLALDHIGSAESDRPALEYRPADYLRFAVRFLDKTADSPVCVCAHADSVPLAVALALSRPDRVGSLVLTNPELPALSFARKRVGDGPVPGPAPIPLLEVVAGLKTSLELRRRLHVIAAAGRGRHGLLRYGAVKAVVMQPGYKAVAARRMRHAHLWSEWILRAGEITIPTRIVVGSAYHRRCAASVAALQKELRSAEVVTIEGAGRYPMIEAPEAFVRAILR